MYTPVIEKPRTLNEFARAIHLISQAKGWYEVDRSPLEFHMLMVSELAEATEEARKGTPPVYVTNYKGEPAEIAFVSPESFIMTGPDGYTKPIKPEGEAIEVIDCLIRLLDYCEYRGWDTEALVNAKMEYNVSRPHRHGGKKY